MEKPETIAKNTNEVLVWIETIVKYSFHNPESVNGPFGNYELSLFSNKTAYGEMEIDAVWELGTKTKLSLKGTYSYAENNVIINVLGHGTETITVFENGKLKTISRQVELSIEITIFTNYLTGGVNFGDVLPGTFGKELPAKCTYLEKRYPFT
jgi:hypothetical protein